MPMIEPLEPIEAAAVSYSLVSCRCEVPLAHVGGGIADALELFSDGHFLTSEMHLVRGVNPAVDTGADAESSGHE